MKICNDLAVAIRNGVRKAKSDLDPDDLRHGYIVGCDLYVYLVERRDSSHYKHNEKNATDLVWEVVVEFSSYYGTQFGHYCSELLNQRTYSQASAWIAAEILEKRLLDDCNYVLCLDIPNEAIHYEDFCKEAEKRLLNRAREGARTNQETYDNYHRRDYECSNFW